MIFDGIEWDENNLDHARRRVTAAEIEEVITNATSAIASTATTRIVFCSPITRTAASE